MSRTSPQGQAFIDRVVALPAGPGVTDQLHQALSPSLQQESDWRKLWATDRNNTTLQNPYLGLIDVFDAPVDIRTTRARVVADQVDLSAKYVMPVSEVNRRKEGTLCTVADMEEFKKNWAIFSEGSLSQLLDWNNVVVAGGSVLACLAPLPDEAKVSKRAIRKFYHSSAYPSSDVDVFLWGLTPAQAEEKIVKIYEAVRDSIPWDVTCIRTKHTVSIHSQYPYRAVQIVLRLYSSPAEILAGFDIDACCAIYDGQSVLANPRAVASWMRQCNLVDISRRSPSYEIRLAKYSLRGFEVHDPSLSRADIDPTIYERSIARIEGLARLLVLEHLKDADSRYTFLEARRGLRGRPNALSRYNRRKTKYRGDLKTEAANGGLAGLEMNDYDVASLHIPYGPGWDARRIDKLVYSTDLGMNSTFNPKNKGRRLHRHPAFFGTMQECLEDCCGNCPGPIDDDEKKLKEEEEKQYITGRIAFIEEDPGRQTMSGSFNPIDVGEWTAQVYIGPTEKLFTAIVANDKPAVDALIKDGVDVNRRDHVGRSPLHMAIFSRRPEIASLLIDSGARVTARIVDGRTPLHMAAQLDLLDVAKKIFEKSRANAEAAPKDEVEEGDNSLPLADPERPSSEDDWTSEDDGVVSLDDDDDDADNEEDEEDVGDEDDEDTDEDAEEDDEDYVKPKQGPSTTSPPDATTDLGDLPEDSQDVPDVVDVNLTDWDVAFTALSYAILFGSIPLVELLLAEGADPKLVSGNNHTSHYHPLFLTTLRDDEDQACKVAEALIRAGAVSSSANDDMQTILLKFVNTDKVKLVSTLLYHDPKAKAVLDFPEVQYSDIYFPLVSAISRGEYGMVLALLAHGAKISYTDEDVTHAIQSKKMKRSGYYDEEGTYTQKILMPLEPALANHDELYRVLLAVGADVNYGLKRSLYRYASADDRFSFLDYVQLAKNQLDQDLEVPETDDQESATGSDSEASTQGPWALYAANLFKLRPTPPLEEDDYDRKGLERYEKQDTRQFFAEVETLLLDKGAKTWNEIYTNPDKASVAIIKPAKIDTKRVVKDDVQSKFMYLSDNYSRNYVPLHLNAKYTELFEACFAGDNKKVQELCLTPEGSKTTALQITVQMCHPDDQWNRTGFTPLLAAFCGRKWDTAQLIVSISAAQYEPEEEEQEKFDLQGLDLDSDGSDDSDSDCSDETVGVGEVSFIDVANRSSAVKCKVNPKKMLTDCEFTWWDPIAESTYNGQLLLNAVHNKDLDAFTKIADILQKLPNPIVPSRVLLDAILQKDDPEILDQFIRRTGFGISLESAEPEAGETLARNDKNRVYLGLDVHGKKRKDLAYKNDPNSVQSDDGDGIPLVWKAAHLKASVIIDYLSGERPLAAYRHYATHGVDDRAERLRHKNDLGDVIPDLLGWTTGKGGESPLIASVLSQDISIVKKMFATHPRLIGSVLHNNLQFIGYNALTVAVHGGCDSELFDFLLGKGLSPAARNECKGWNILHLLADRNDGELLEHVLKKLPGDVIEALLVQQSKGGQNTPLHLAVKQGYIRQVKQIVNFSSSSLLMRDGSGSLPIHSAVSKAFPNITRFLLEKHPESLGMENGVGDTPSEIIEQKQLLDRTGRLNNNRTSSSQLQPNNIMARPFRFEKSAGKVERLHVVLADLVKDGTLANDSVLFKEFSSLADRLKKGEEEFTATRDKFLATKKPLTPADEDKNPVDDTNVDDVLRELKAVAETYLGKRGLVHLIDVQRSVQRDLEGSVRATGSGHEYHEDGLEAEEDAAETERKSLMICSHLGYDIYSEDET